MHTPSRLKAADRAALFSVHDRVGKGPLLDQCIHANERIALLSKRVNFEEGDGLGELTNLVNRTSLISYRAGRSDLACEIITAFLALSLRQYRQTERVGWLGCVVQPLINYGRLNALNGEYEAANHTFLALREFFAGRKALNLGSEMIPVSCAEMLSRKDPGLVPVVNNVFLVDTIRSYLIAERWGELEQFVDSLQAGDHMDSYHRQVLLEAHTLIELKGDRLSIASRSCALWWEISKATGNPEPAFLSRFISVYVAAGRKDLAHTVLSTMTAYSRQMESSESLEQANQRLLYTIITSSLDADDLTSALDNSVHFLHTRQFSKNQQLETRLLCLLLEMELCGLAPPSRLVSESSLLRTRLSCALDGIPYFIESSMLSKLASEYPALASLLERDIGASGAGIPQSAHITRNLYTTAAARGESRELPRIKILEDLSDNLKQMMAQIS